MTDGSRTFSRGEEAEAQWPVQAQGTPCPGMAVSPLSRKSQEGKTREKGPLERGTELGRFDALSDPPSWIVGKNSRPSEELKFKERRKRTWFTSGEEGGCDSHPAPSEHLRA